MQELDYKDYFLRLADTPGLSLVTFTAPFCGACKRLLRALEDRPAPLGATLYRVDASQNQGLVDELEFFHLPAMFLYIDGQYHAQVHSEARYESLEAELLRLREAPAEPEP